MFAINLFSSLDKKRKCFTLSEGKTIREYLNEEHIDYDNTIILVGGHKVDADYRPKEDDIVFVRELPKAATTVALIITAVVAVVAGVAAGVSLYKAKEAQKEAEKAMKNANASMSNNVEALPFLRGATNQAASGRSFPYIIGRHYFTPYRLQPRYYEVLGSEGKTEFCNLVLEAGFKNLVIESISLGNNKIKSFADSYSEVQQIEPQNLITGFNAGTYFNAENVIEIKQEDAFTTEQFNKKIVSNFVNQEIDNSYGTPEADIPVVVTQLEDNAKSTDVCIMFDGLRKLVNNNWQNQKVTIIAYWSNKESPDVKNLDDWNVLPPFEQYEWDGTYTITKSNKYWFRLPAMINNFGVSSKRLSESKIKNKLIENVHGIVGWTFISGDEPFYLDNVTANSSNIYDLKYTERKEGNYWVYSDISWTYAISKEKNYTKRFESNIFDYNSNNQMRFISHKDFTFDETFGKHISIMLKRITPKAEGNSNENCYLYYVNTEVFDYEKSRKASELITCKPLEDDAREKCCRIGIRMKADDNNESLADNINIVACGVARTWNAEENRWSDEKTPTRNGAAWILEVLTSDVHQWSKFDDDEIILESLGQLYETCEQKGYFVDGVVTEEKTKQSILDDLCAACHCTLIWNNDGKLEVIEDKKEQNAIALLNTQDISDFTVTKSFARKPDGYKVTFTNNESWTKETFYCMKDGTSNHGATDVITEIAPNFITDYSHAWDIARRTLAESYLQPKTVMVNVGKEGAYYPIHSTVLVQLPHLKIGLASSVVTALVYENSKIIGLKIADKVTFENGKSYGVIIQQMDEHGKHLIDAVVTGEGTTDTLYLDGSDWNYIPTAQNIVSFGEVDADGVSKVSEKFKICGIEPTENGYKLTLKEYNEAIYDDSGEIPEYKSPVSVSSINSANKDYNYSNAEIREQIDESQKVTLATIETFASGVNVYSDVQIAGLYTDEDGKTVQPQTITTTIHAVQGGTEELDFIFGEIPQMEGMTITTEYHTVTIKVDEGVKVDFGSIHIPVIYRQIIQNYNYADENGEVYADENGESYGMFEVSNTSKEYDFELKVVGVKAGGHKSAVKTIEELVDIQFTVGDFFVWQGEDAESTLAELGQFQKGSVYLYCGTDSERKWQFKVDDNQQDMMTSLSDVVAVLDEEIKQNNIRVTTLLNNLVANNIFVKNLVAQTAFIDNLFSKELTMENGGVIHSKNYNEDSIKEDEQGNKYIDTENYSDTGWAMDSKGNADFVNLHATNGTFEGEINANKGLVIQKWSSYEQDYESGYLGSPLFVVLRNVFEDIKEYRNYTEDKYLSVSGIVKFYEKGTSGTSHRCLINCMSYRSSIVYELEHVGVTFYGCDIDTGERCYFYINDNKPLQVDSNYSSTKGSSACTLYY